MRVREEGLQLSGGCPLSPEPAEMQTHPRALARSCARARLLRDDRDPTDPCRLAQTPWLREEQKDDSRSV